MMCRAHHCGLAQTKSSTVDIESIIIIKGFLGPVPTSFNSFGIIEFCAE